MESATLAGEEKAARLAEEKARKDKEAARHEAEKAAKLAEEKARKEKAAARREAEKATRLAEEKARKEKLARSAVKQPGTNLYWLRCPIGQTWTGTSCKGSARGMSWHKAKKACPAGYRLHTLQEFVSLFGGCDARVKNGKVHSCNRCSKSTACSSMFGKDTEWYWTSSSYADDASRAWYVYFYSGAVSNYDEGSAGGIRCVRRGP